jgi:3-phenylpropionate/trans-cinnamate dioxygenase ferredoxin subunit
VTVAGKSIALFNVDGTIYAIDDSCLHEEQSLGTSRLEGEIVACRAHGWRYDVTTGCMPGVKDFGVASYRAKVEGGRILVDIAD